MLRLPAVEVSEEEFVDRQSVSITSKRILIMEDVAAVRRVLQRSLESLGHEVVTVSEGGECLERFQDDREPWWLPMCIMSTDARSSRLFHPIVERLCSGLAVFGVPNKYSGN